MNMVKGSGEAEDSAFRIGALGFDDYAYGEINEKILAKNGVLPIKNEIIQQVHADKEEEIELSE